MACNRDKTTDQMKIWKENRGSQRPDTLTTGAGHPVGDKLNLQTAGPRGPLLVQDVVFTDEMAHFDRERIPERVVHAKGAGAFGYFEVTHDITRYCKAKVFEHVGKTTPLAVRFSTVAGESGSADTVRDPRGFAVKFYTEEGNWDLTGNNTPIFFIRDALLFPSFIHSQKRNPQTHMKDPDMVWDFWSLRPESLHQVSFLFSDRGLPDGYRHMNGYGSHTFKLVNADGEHFYCKFHYKTDQGIKNLSVEEAERLASTNPDYAIGDLFNAIADGNFPSWTFYIQIMTFEQAEKFQFNPFDLTKVWSHKEYPLIPVGKMVLNRNPVNYFAEVEQLAFDPSNMPPGIEPSPDKMLQGRLFSYPDTHRHRLGANYLQLPVNCPFRARVTNYQRDGPMCMFDNQGGAPNYYPNSFSAPETQPRFVESKFKVSPDVARYNSEDEDNVTQVRTFFTQVLNEEERQRLCQNMAGALRGAQLFIQKRMRALQTTAELTAMNPVRHPAEVVPLQAAYNMPPGQPGGATVAQYTTVNVISEPPKDHIIWSLFSFVYSNPFCLGLAALIFSIKSRDRKMIGDLDGARHYASTARCLNIWATVLTSIMILICIIVFIVTTVQINQAYRRYSTYSYYK